MAVRDAQRRVASAPQGPATVAVGVEILSALWPRARLDDCRRLFYHLDLCRMCELQALERVLSMAAAATRVLGSAVRRRMHGKPSHTTHEPRHPSQSSAQHSCDPKMSAALSCRRNSHALLLPCACPPVCIVSALVSGCEVPCQCGALVTCRCPCLLSCRNVRAWRAVAFTLWQRMGAV